MTGHEEIHAELLGVVTDAILNHPRSLQVRIGPSEMGQACARRIGYKLAGMAEVNGGRVPWKPTIGTALHSWMEEHFQAASMARPDFEATGGRYLVETLLEVGEILGEPITGHGDLYFDGVSVDFKVVGDDQIRKYKAKGPGPQYRAQGHLYGRGWARRGMPIRTVAVWFLPRNQELDRNHLWTEAYDERVALDAITRVEGIAKLVQALGTKSAGLLPTADDYCRFCPYFKARSTDLTQGCPGDQGANDAATAAASKSLTDLIAK